MGVHDDGYRAVASERHLHIGTECAGLHRFAEHLRHDTAEFLVHRNGEVGFGSVDVAWAVAFACARHQRELADNKYTGVWKVSYWHVHHSVSIIEDTHGCDFAAQIVDVLVGVAVFDTKKNQKSATYLAFTGSVNVDRS